MKKYEKADKVVYYQANPLANWGPASKAKNVKATPVAAAEKRKSEAGEQDTKEVKKTKIEVEGVEGAEEEGLNTV